MSEIREKSPWNVEDAYMYWALKFQKLPRSLRVPWTTVTDSSLCTHDCFNSFWPKKLVPFWQNPGSTPVHKHKNSAIVCFPIDMGCMLTSLNKWTRLNRSRGSSCDGDKRRGSLCDRSWEIPSEQVWLGVGGLHMTSDWPMASPSSGHLGIPHEEKWQTDTIENIAFPQTTFADGNNYAFVFLRLLFHLCLGWQQLVWIMRMRAIV